MSTPLLISQRVFNQPLFVMPSKLVIIASFLGERMGANIEWDQIAPKADRFEGSWVETAADGRQRRNTFRTVGTTAVISIVGELCNRGAWIGANSGLVSYEGIRRQLKDAAASSAIKSILLDIESPGGEAVGAGETADLIRSIRETKPVVAVVNGMAASAGYMLASAASKIVTTKTGISGSIGVVMVHVDHSAMLEKRGVKPTLIHSGAHKVDGNPYEPLPEQVHSDMQTWCDQFYEQFLATVEAGRGVRFNAEAARATQARIYSGDDAVRLGLADVIGTYESAIADLQAAQPGNTSQPVRRTAMTTEANTTTTTEATISASEHTTAIAKAKAESFEAGKAEGMKAGAEAERLRISAILGAPEAKGREALAQHFVASGMDAQAAISAMAVSAVSSGSSLSTTMKTAPNTDLGNPTAPNEPEPNTVDSGRSRARAVLPAKKSA